MTVRIKIATTADEHDALFRVRHRVYVEQDGYLPPRPDGRIYDRFDSFPTTTNLIAVAGGEVIGGVRLAEPCAAGLPADDYFDFGPCLPREGARAGSASMLCMDRGYRHRKRVTRCLCSMFYYLATLRGLSHVLAPCNPAIEAAMLQTGYRRVAPVFRHGSGVDVSPLLLDLSDIGDHMVRFVRTHGQAHLVSSLERAFCAEGETVVRAGEPGSAAYVILEGVAFAELAGADGKQYCERLGPGDMFGELSLLTGRPQSATVVAASDLDLMVLDAGTLRQQLCTEPERAMAFIERLSRRLLDVLAGRTKVAAIEIAAQNHAA